MSRRTGSRTCFTTTRRISRRGSAHGWKGASAAMDDKPSAARRAAGWLAGSVFFEGMVALWARNEKDCYLPLTKFQKARLGIYLVLRDYASGTFPPKFPDREKAHEDERQ